MGKAAQGDARRERLPKLRLGCLSGSQAPNLLLLLLLLLFSPWTLAEDRSPERRCNLPCECPAEPPACAPGVPPVLDGCSCCLICARQRGENCSEATPCDESAGLYCDRGAGREAGLGVCMAVRPSSPTVNTTVPAGMDRSAVCPSAMLICCFLAPNAPSQGKLKSPRNAVNNGHVILKQRTQQTLQWKEATLGAEGSDSSSNCIQQTTEWSACSTSCGMGASTRVTNKNPMCEMVKETRLCEVRPCEKSPPPDKKGKKCLRTIKPPTAAHLEYQNCTSIQMYKPRYCGICNDGRCCTPHTTKTIQVEFRCPQGNTIQHPVMSIISYAYFIKKQLQFSLKKKQERKKEKEEKKRVQASCSLDESSSRWRKDPQEFTHSFQEKRSQSFNLCHQ
ncbi:hypothetical protein E2320_011682, partial [Naja naja]